MLNKKENAMVRRFFKLWKEIGDQLFYESLMMELFCFFETFQNNGQKSMVTLCDIETFKNIGISFLKMMEMIVIHEIKKKN